MIQPLVARPTNGKYELIASERGWRATTKLGVAEVPVIVKEATYEEALAMALIEDIQRDDLDPIEEAEANGRLIVDLSLNHEEIAKSVGKKPSSVTDNLRALDLDRDVQILFSEKRITHGHVKTLLKVKNRPKQKMLADIVVRKELNESETETLVQEHENKIPQKSSASLPSALGNNSQRNSAKREWCRAPNRINRQF